MACTQLAIGGVVKRVVLKGAWRLKPEAETGETLLKLCGVGDGEFQLDLSALHGASIRR